MATTNSETSSKVGASLGSRFLKLFASPWAAAIAGVAAAILSLWVGIRKDAFIQSFKVWGLLEDRPLPHGLDFFVLAGLLGLVVLLVLLQKYGDSLKSNEKQSDLKSGLTTLSVATGNISALQTGLNQGISTLTTTVGRLDQEVETLASFGLRRISAEFYVTVQSAFSAFRVCMDESPTPKTLQTAIQIVLNDMQAFVAKIDVADPDDYSCSIFLFRDYAQLSKSKDTVRCKKILAHNAVLQEPITLDPKELSGVLELLPELNVLGTDEALALPVPVVGQGMLPGAPVSATNRKPMIFRSQHSIVDWCAQNTLLDETRRSKIISYFSKHSVRSFISIPLLQQTRKDQFELTGVICIERRSEGILAGSREDVFSNLTVPLVIFLSHLVKAYGNQVPLEASAPLW